jgi:hypothetical protein
MNSCGRNQYPRNNQFRRQAGIPACDAGCKKLHCWCSRRKGVRQSGPHNQGKRNGGRIREQSWIARSNRSGASYFYSRPSSFFFLSTLPTARDHEPVFFEDLSQHRDRSWWAGLVDHRVIRSAPLVGAGQPPRAQNCPAGGQFVCTRPIRHPAPSTPIQGRNAGGTK